MVQGLKDEETITISTVAPSSQGEKGVCKEDRLGFQIESKNRAPNKLTGPVYRALELLSAHHSNPQYKEMAYHWKGHSPHQWAAWSPQLPKSAQPRRKTKDDKNQKDKKEGVAKPYDSTSTSAGGSASSDGQSTEMVFMKEFLNFMKESGAEVPERFQKFMPNDKMADIRLQQKKLKNNGMWHKRSTTSERP